MLSFDLDPASFDKLVEAVAQRVNKGRSKDAPPEPPLDGRTAYTYKEVSVMLYGSKDVSHRVRDAFSRHGVTTYKLGKFRMVDRDELMKFIERRKAEQD